MTDTYIRCIIDVENKEKEKTKMKEETIKAYESYKEIINSGNYPQMIYNTTQRKYYVFEHVDSRSYTEINYEEDIEIPCDVIKDAEYQLWKENKKRNKKKIAEEIEKYIEYMIIKEKETREEQEEIWKCE